MKYSNSGIPGIVVLALALAAGLPVGGEAQVFHRARCSSITCADSIYGLELERMALTEGALASDRDAGDLSYLRVRIERDLEARPGDPWLWLALSEVELGLGDPSRAMGAASRALAEGGDSALALRAQGAARMRMAGGEQDGARLYLNGLARMTRASSPRFLADLLPMLSRDELDWWRSADIERLREWTRDYWSYRAALAGVTLEERLAEHMRRTAAASRMYAPPGTGSGAVGYDDVLRQRELRALPYDDRGLVYIRRGPPHRKLRVPSDIFSGMPQESWLYGGVDGSVDAFHFARGMSSGSGFRFVVAPACDPGAGGAGLVASVTEGWVMANAGTDAASSRAAVSCFSGDARTQRANARLNAIAMRREAMRALSLESPRPPFRRAIPAYFDFYMFRGANGSTEVVTPVVVPVEANVREPVDLLVTFADETGGVVRREATSSTLRTEVRQSIVSAGEGWGVAYVTTSVRPTERATFRLLVRDPDDADRGGMWGGPLSVPSLTRPGIEMSDVVVSGSGPGTWSRASTRLFLLPARSFEPGMPAILFYELYDLEPGTTYRTELTLRPVEESVGARLWRRLTGGGQLRIAFDAEVPDDAGSTLQEVRSLELPTEEGRYSLTVRVTSAAGEVTETAREIVISQDAAAPSGGPAGADIESATD